MDIFEKARQTCLALTKTLVNNKNGGPFSSPVDYVALNIPDYPLIIKHPMDLGTIQKKLNSHKYSSVDEWMADVRLVFMNAATFNPPNHIIHQMANTLNTVFDKKLATLFDKLETRSFIDDGRGPILAPPVSAGGAGTPGLTSWPRKAKQVLKSVMEHPQAFPFNEPVDWKQLNIPDYPKIIKVPMDLGKIEKRLSQGHYTTLDNFVADVKLVFTNAKTYNVEFSDIHQMAKVIEAHFEEKFATVFKGHKRPPADRKHRALKKTKSEDGDDDLSDVSQDLPDDLTDEERTRPISIEEKREMQDRIWELKSEDLGRMVEIVKERCLKSIDQSKEDEVEIDIDALSISDFRYLAKFIHMRATRR